MIRISRATNLDAGPMTRALSRADILDRIDHDPARCPWHVARDANGSDCGIQYIGPHGALAPAACDIATFVRIGAFQHHCPGGPRIGRYLDPRQYPRRQLQRPDPRPKPGLPDCGRIQGHRLASHQIADKVLKRCGLDGPIASFWSKIPKKTDASPRRALRQNALQSAPVHV